MQGGLFRIFRLHRDNFLHLSRDVPVAQMDGGDLIHWETILINFLNLNLNDSKYIGMSVYNVFVLSIIGASVSLFFEGSVHHEAPYAILSMCLIVSTSVTLLLVFVPKVRILNVPN